MYIKIDLKNQWFSELVAFLALRYTSWREWKLPDKTVALLLGESRAYAYNHGRYFLNRSEMYKPDRTTMFDLTYFFSGYVDYICVE